MCGPDCNLVDPCQENESPCLNNGLCIETCSTYSDYMCQCVDGFAGKNCSELVNSANEYFWQSKSYQFFVVGFSIIGSYNSRHCVNRCPNSCWIVSNMWHYSYRLFSDGKK